MAHTGYLARLETSHTIDQTRTSKHGSCNLLKCALFQIIALMIWFERETKPYKELCEHMLAEGRSWYRAMLCAYAAQARHFYFCSDMKAHQPYDVSKAFRQQVGQIASDPTLINLQASLDEEFEELQAKTSLQDD